MQDWQEAERREPDSTEQQLLSVLDTVRTFDLRIELVFWDGLFYLHVLQMFIATFDE